MSPLLQLNVLKMLVSKKSFGEAAVVGESLLKSIGARHGKSNSHYRDTMKTHLQTLTELSKFAEIETLASDTLPLYIGELGEKNADTIDMMNVLANCYHYQGKYMLAARMYIQMLQSQLLLTPTDVTDPVSLDFHDKLTDSINQVGLSYVGKEGKTIDAAVWILNGLVKIQSATFGPHHPKAIQCLTNLGLLVCSVNDAAFSESVVGDIISVFTKIAGPDCEEIVIWKKNLATVYLQTGKPEVADTLLVECMDILKRRGCAEDHPDVVETREMLAHIKPPPDSNAVMRPT